MDGWMNIKVLINKMDGDKNTNMSCSGGEDAAKATEELMMKHKKTNEVFFYPVEVWTIRLV